MNEVPRPPGLRPDGTADTENVCLHRSLDKVSVQQSQLHLRLYQVEVIAKIAAERAAGRRKIILVAPTGAGKTVIASEIIADAEKRGERCLFLVHRRELVGQGHRKLHTAGIDAGVILAGGPSMRLHRPVQVACIPTLHARAIRTSKIDLPDADIVIVDEAHHARARTWQQLINRYPNALILGMTATPCRRDGLGLGNIFEALVECPQIAELIQGKYLVGAHLYAPSRPDLRGISVQHGDYVESQLEERMNTKVLVGDVVEHYFKLAQSRRTVVFATGVDHSVHLRNEFRRAGVLAEHLDSSTPVDTRERILKQLSVGEIDVVTNCMILTEGWDQPEVSCIILARPTKSFGLYRQMVGRGLRPAAGKSDLIVIDHAGCVFAHGLPEDPVKWSLREDERVVNAVHAARGQPGHMPRLTDCPECHAVREEGRPCGVCGWRPQPKPRNVDVIDGELVRVQRDRTAPAAMSDLNTRRGFYGELLHIALSRNYAKGWAAYKFRDKFGVLPPWHWNLSVSPKPPSPATLAWVRSRQIAYAKSRQTKPRP